MKQNDSGEKMRERDGYEIQMLPARKRKKWGVVCVVGRERKRAWRRMNKMDGNNRGWRGEEEELRLPVLAVRYDSCPVHCWPTNLDEQRASEREKTLPDYVAAAQWHRVSSKRFSNERQIRGVRQKKIGPTPTTDAPKE